MGCTPGSSHCCCCSTCGKTGCLLLPTLPAFLVLPAPKPLAAYTTRGRRCSRPAGLLVSLLLASIAARYCCCCCGSQRDPDPLRLHVAVLPPHTGGTIIEEMCTSTLSFGLGKRNCHFHGSCLKPGASCQNIRRKKQQDQTQTLTLLVLSTLRLPTAWKAVAQGHHKSSTMQAHVPFVFV
jgi:hypothetical protein